MKIPATDLIPCVTKLISEKWQQFWNSCTGNKLQAIRSTVGTINRSHPCLIRMKWSLTDLGLVIRDAYILICCQVQTNLSAPTVHAHSLLSTSSSSVLVLMILALNILSLPLWSNNNIVQDC